METSGPFQARDWMLFASVAALWGSSFLFIKLGAERLPIVWVALGRSGLAVATLALVPAARRSLPWRAWPRVALLGLVWMAVPFMLFPLAEQRVSSSMAGMLNATAPLWTAVFTTIAGRRLPGARLVGSLLIGFLGVAVMTWPSASGSAASWVGVALVLAATVLYGVAFTLAGPLQQQYGALPVIWRALLVSLVLQLPAGIVAGPPADVTPSGVLAVGALAVLSTAVAFVAFTTLAGRVGSARASVAVYLVPAVALVLGALTVHEHVPLAAIPGCALVLAGAYLTGRTQRPGTSPRPGTSRSTEQTTDHQPTERYAPT
ncbi:DMT family transporter [Actinomadura rupiterrae]|uniref:DMT family transporter n=1 Tax=Actinomadura rupiterrae TaxID=559627 RepID=UPI0020A2D749|nr:DMT family transporter [Actinomadura rupiterrae]MCP2337992.1 drug/metabolite transporter (DMT)-like permease [Actinomadura rupiterrae]